MTLRRKPLYLLIASLPIALHALSAVAAEPVQLDEVLVNAHHTPNPFTVVSNPKAIRQPIPASDGSGALAGIAGVNLTRKGGSGSEIILRGLGAGRLNILADGTTIFGGCGGRMDPPSAYIYPDTFDSLTVIKGPQSVKYGPVGVAGTVLFERDTASQPRGVSGQASATFGSAGRNDQAAELTVSNALAYLRLSGQRNESRDYQDGAGRDIHSANQRHSAAATLGFTPDADTLIELSYDWSRGEGAYADRMMDGAKFDRDAWQIKAERRNLTPWLTQISAHYFRSYVDHVMDNYSLRRAPSMLSGRSVSNPDREVEGGKLAAELQLGSSEISLGVDFQNDWHSLRSAQGATTAAYENLSRKADMRLSNFGVFVEGRYPLTTQTRLITGLRHDQAEATDQRSGLSTSGQTRSDSLWSGFVRAEHQISPEWQAYAGWGHTERAPDYWERSRTFNVKPEKNDQIDLGLGWKQGEWEGSAALFHHMARDFILIQASPSRAFNIDATRTGGELNLAWRFAPHWKASGQLAYVYGQNDSENRPLAQTPPLNARLSLDYDRDNWSAGASIKAATRQTRTDAGRGNVIGQDQSTESAGYGVVSLYAGWKPNKQASIVAGIDNVFDKEYAEALSRAGASGMALPAGYESMLRVNEPGRTFWLKGQYRF